MYVNYDCFIKAIVEICSLKRPCTPLIGSVCNKGFTLFFLAAAMSNVGAVSNLSKTFANASISMFIFQRQKENCIPNAII